MAEYTKPLPLLTSLSKTFYEGCKENKLLYQHCKDCGEVIFYPKIVCPACMGTNLDWKESAGKGKIFSFTVAYDFAPPEFASSTPYALAVVNLDEGFSMLTNIVDCDLEKLQCDMPVEVLFDPVTPEITLPKFRPVPE
ncbi:Zn-ribbon domain-containing OB-fold protein [Desulfatibacillum aliphaticivorans]|uniref:Zn-ribbon domain-containing OB-fold protein n=1 Tax=Desulfatibacillum aliphaticivorans TaxID=218208 RepID=UPI0004091336|nr:Zn-ribbon domain-containing OB-fold protein [Desulfatibacillum aliphaticivorans]